MLSRFKKDKTGSLLRAARVGNLEKVIGLLNRKVDVNACDTSGLTALHLSAKEGYVAVVKELLKRGAKVDAQTKKKNTPLHISCLSGKLEAVKMLVDGGANVNAQSMNGFTPLYMASQEGHVEVVRLLVANRADPNLATDDGFTPLSVALQQGHVEVVRFLMEQGPSSKKHSLSALHMAAKNNDSKAVKLLLQNDGVDCNRTTRSGFTPLHIASHYGHVDIGLALLQRMADVNTSARNGITPLHVASKRGHLDMVKLLVSSGADLDSKTMDGMTPLHCASKSGHHQVIRYLLEKGSKVNPKTKHGLTPLHNASQSDNAECCKVLLNNKASINEGTVDDLTPLHVAAHFGNVKSGKLLLEKRCDVDARTKAGFTPLHVAIIKKKPRMVELLLRFGANLDAQTATGLSPMHVAAVTGSSPIASSLLQSGNVNVNSRTSRGDTPLHLATRNNHLDIVGALLHGGAQVDVKGTEHRLTPLHISSQLGHSESTCLLLKHGSSPDSKTSEMMTPLHLAASKNSLECAAHLLEHGANADVANKSGYTPLHTAIKHNSLEVARLLKDRGVSTEVEGSNGIKPLHVATRYNHLDALQLLLESGAMTNCRAHNGYTPLHVAAQENRINIANLLLAQGADVNPVSKAQVTPLHLSCKEGNDKFAKLLLDKGAHVNSLTSSSLSPIHYAAMSGKPEVVELLETFGADVMSRDTNDNTPLHLACYHGKSAVAAYLLKHGADPNVTNKLGMTPLHYSAQNGDISSVNTLLNNGAEPNALSNDGWSPLCIAQRNGYGELASLLLPLTLDRCLYFPDDLEKGGSDVDGVQSFVFSSPYPRPKVLINLDQVDLEPVKELPTDFDDNDLFELDKLEGMGSVTSLGPGATDDDLRYIRDGEEICFSSYAGLKSSEIRTKSPLVSRPISSLSSRPASPSFNNFLVSFMVDARGGSMYGQRHSGVSVFVPPGCASSPVRVTCRYLAPEKLRHPPPLLPEGEDLACRVIEVGPTGHQFLGPVTLKVPHYASLRDGAREIVIMRSDDGRTWNNHLPPPAQEALAREMDASGILPDDLLDLQKQHVTIVTDKFPVYFALVTRPKRQSEDVGSEGGILTSPLNRDVQVILPQGAVKRDTQVQLQIIDVPDDMVDFEFGGKARVSPIVVIEPKRRKFHTPVTVKIPLPRQKTQDDYMVTRLLCSVSGDKSTSKWEDITDKTPLTFINNCAAFLTSISARYWLVKVKQTSENWIEKATLVQQGASAVPFLAQFVVLGKRASQREGNFRIFCVTEDRADKIKDAQRNCDFEEITKSQEVEVLQGKPLYLDVDGDLTLARKPQGDLHSLIFHSFRENRLPVRARYSDDFLKAWLERGMTDLAKGRFLFHHTPSHLTPVTQIPVCSLEVYMPEGESGDLMCCNVGAESDSLELRTTANRAEEHISKAELRLTDIADALDTDWIPLALQLGLTPHDVAAIQSDYDFLPEQALVMLHTWVQRHKDKATGNNLEKALKQINREDVLSRCMYNIRQVTDVHEMAVAKEYLDSSLDAPKDYLGSGADVASSRGSSMQRGVSLDRSYGEHASFKDASLFDSGSESASLLGKDELGKDKLKIGRGSDRFIYMDGSKSPSNLTVTPSESDVEFLPTADVCELDAGVEYELEEIWDGTRWKYVHNVPKKTKDKTQGKDDLKKIEDTTFGSLTVEAASPTGRTTPIVDVSDTDLPGTIQKNIVDEPDDEANVSSTSFRGRKVPMVTDVSDSLEVAMRNTETSLASVKEEEQVLEDDDEREKTPIIEVLEDQDYKKTTTDSREEQLEDGSTLRYKTQTIQTVRPVVEKYYSAGRWREERKELIVGEDIQEEVLELAPGVNVEHGTDLESETTVEEFNETLPNGTWIMKKVSRIKVSRKRSPARTVTSPWDDAIATGRKIPITSLPRDSPKEIRVKDQSPSERADVKTGSKLATRVEAVPILPAQTHEMKSRSTDTMEKMLKGDIIEEPEIVEHEELLPDGTILHYRTITRKLKRPRTRKVMRDGSTIETVTEHELVATTVEDEITEVSVDAQKLERSETAEKSIMSIEEFEEQMPDKSILRRKIIRSSLKLHPGTSSTPQDTLKSEADIPAIDNVTKSTEHKISEAHILETTERIKDGSTISTQEIQQTPQTSTRDFIEVSKQLVVQEPAKSIEPEFKHPQQESVTPIPPAKVQQFKVVEKTPEVVDRERITETQVAQVASKAETKTRRVHQETVAITELSPEEETVNILTPIESPVTLQTLYKVKPPKDLQETSAVPASESPVAPKRGAKLLHISPAPVMPVGQTTVLSSPSSPTSGPYELPPITETLGVQEWEDIKPDGTRQCFKIVTKRKMRPIAVMRPSLEGNGFIEKIIKKEKIGVEIDEEITEIAPNVTLDEEEDLDKTTSIDEFHETASDGTWVKRKVRRTEIKRSEDVEEYVSEESASSAEQEELATEQFYDQEQSLDEKRTTSLTERLEKTEEHHKTIRTTESIPIPLPRTKTQEVESKTWTAQTLSEASESTSLFSQLHHHTGSLVEERVDPVLGRITVVTFADQPRVDEREETDSFGGTLRYKILTRNFKKRTFKKYDDGSERLIREENFGTEVEEHIEEIEAGLKGDDEVGVERKTSEDEFNETMPDGTWLKRKVSHAKIYRKRREEFTQRLPTPVRSPKIGSKFVHGHSLEQVTEPKCDEREEVTPDGTKLKFKVTSRDHVVRAGSERKRLGTEITEEIVEISPEVICDDDEFTDKVTTVSETEDVLQDGTWIKRKIVHVKITRRQLKSEDKQQYEAMAQLAESKTQQSEQPNVQRALPLASNAPKDSEFTEVANVEEHEELSENGSLVTYKKTTKKCLKPVTEKIVMDGEVVERVSHEVELGTLILEETVEYEPGLVPDFMDYTEEENEKVHVYAVCEESSNLLPDNKWLKKRHVLTKVEWKKEQPGKAPVRSDEVPQVISQQEVELQAQRQIPVEQLTELPTLPAQIVTTKERQAFSTISKTVHSKQVLATQEVNIMERTEPSTSITTQPSEATSFQTAPGEYKQLIKSPLKTAGQTPFGIEKPGQSMDRKDELFVEEESLEETDLDEIFDEVSRMENQKVVQVKRKDDEVQTTASDSLSTTVSTTVTETAIVSQSEESKEITVITRTAEEDFSKEVKADHKDAVVLSGPDYALIKPFDAKPTQEHVVVAVGKEKSDQIVVPETSPTELSEPLAGKIENISIKSGKYEVSILDESKILSHDKATEDKMREAVPQGQIAKPQHLEEYTFGVEEEEDAKKVIEGKMLEQSTVETSAEENQPSIRTVDQSLQSKEPKDVTEILKVKNQQELVVTHTEELFETTIIKAGKEEMLQDLQIEITDSNVVTQTDSRAKTSEIVVDSKSPGDITSSEIQFEVQVEPQVVKGEREETETIIFDKQATFVLEEGEAEKITRTEIVEIPLTVTEEQTLTSVDSYLVVSESKVRESKQVESVQTTVESTSSEIETSKIEVEKLEIPQVEIKLSKEENVEQVPGAFTKPTEIEEKIPESTKATDLKIDTTVVKESSVELPSEGSVNKVTIAKDISVVTKPKKITEVVETTDSTKLKQTHPGKAVDQSDSREKPSAEMKVQTEERSVEEMAAGEVVVEVLEASQVTEEEKLEDAILLKKQTKLPQRIEDKGEKESIEKSDDSLAPRAGKESTQQISEMKEFTVTKKESTTLEVVSVEETQLEIASTALIAGSSTQEFQSIENLPVNEAKIDQRIQVSEVKSEKIENLETSDIVEEMKVDEISQVERKIELTTSESKEAEAQLKPTSDKTIPSKEQLEAKPGTLRVVEEAKDQELLTKVEKIHTDKEEFTTTSASIVPQKEPKVTEESKLTASTEQTKLEELHGIVELTTESGAASESQTLEEVKRDDVMPMVEASKPDLSKTTDNKVLQKSEEPRVTKEDKPKEDKDEPLKSVEYLKLKEVHTNIQPVPDPSQAEAVKHVEEQPEMTNQTELPTVESTPETKDLLKPLEKQEISELPCATEPLVVEEKIEFIKKPTRKEVSDSRTDNRTIVDSQHPESKPRDIEEVTNEELQTSPTDDSFAQKLLQFQIPPEITDESLSFGFTPVQEQVETVERVKEPKPRGIELPHMDFSSTDVSPTQSEKDILESLTKERLENYERVLMNLEQVLEGHDTETKYRAPLALVKAMLYHTRSYSDKESPTEQESREVETPVEKPQVTPMTSLFKRFFSESSIELDTTKVHSEKVTCHFEPEFLEDVTKRATCLAEELGSSILDYFEASGNLLEEKILSMEDGDSKEAMKTVDEHVVEKQSEEFLKGLTESVIEHFQTDQTTQQDVKDSTTSTTTAQPQSTEVLTGQTLTTGDHHANMVIIPQAVVEFPVTLVESMKGSSTDEAKDGGEEKIQEEKPGKVVEDVGMTVIEVLESDIKDSTKHVVTTVTQVEQVKQDVEKTDLTLKDQPSVWQVAEKMPDESQLDQTTKEVVVKSIEHIVEKGTTIETSETQEEVTVQEVSIVKKEETKSQLESATKIEPQESLKEVDIVETDRKEIQQTNVAAETTRVDVMTVVSEETSAEESKTERTAIREFTEDTEKVEEVNVVSEEVQFKKETEKDDSIRVVSAESANLTLERTTLDGRKVTETAMKEIKTEETIEKVVEEVELATTRSEESAEKPTEKIEIESETQHFEASSTSTIQVITESSQQSEQVKSIDEELSKKIQKVKVVSAEVTEDQSREESGEDLVSSTVVDVAKTTISTAVATESSAATTIDVTTTIVTTTTTTTSTSISPSLSTIPLKMEDTAAFLKLVEPLSSQDTSSEAKESMKTESSDTVTLSKALEIEEKLEEKQPTVQTSVETLPSTTRITEEEQDVTFETVEGDVRCKVDESEKYELSEDGKKSITKKVMTRNYYQTHIRNKIKDGVIIAVEPVETFVGKCVDECIFESATDISDPYAADVETTTSIDESEETLEDGTWVKRKTTTVVAYLAHEELDSPSIFLEAVTLPKSPKPAIEEQSQVQKEILKSFGINFPEFFQRTENIDNVKMRIFRLPDSRPKIQENRKGSGAKVTKHSSKKEQQTATSPTSATKVEAKTKREGKPPSFVLPEARSTRTTPPSRTQTDVMSTASTGSKRLLRSRVRRTITRKIRKVLHSGEVIEDVVTEEIPDVEMSETSSIRSGQSDAFDVMSPMSSSVASIASPSDIASPRRRKGSASSHSSLRVYTDTVEGQPEVTTDVQEREETLPDGRVIVRKVIKTKQKQTIVKRVVLEADEDQPGEADISALIGEDDPSIRMYADSLLQEADPSRRSTPGSRGQSSYVDEWLQQAVAASGEAPPTTGFEQPSTGPVVVSRVHSAASSKPKYRVSMERTDATTSSPSAAEEQPK